MVGFLDKVNRTKVSADLLVEVLQVHAAMTPEDRPVYEARAFRLFELLKSKGIRTAELRRSRPRLIFGLLRWHGLSAMPRCEDGRCQGKNRAPD